MKRLRHASYLCLLSGALVVGALSAPASARAEQTLRVIPAFLDANDVMVADSVDPAYEQAPLHYSWIAWVEDAQEQPAGPFSLSLTFRVPGAMHLGIDGLTVSTPTVTTRIATGQCTHAYIQETFESRWTCPAAIDLGADETVLIAAHVTPVFSELQHNFRLQIDTVLAEGPTSVTVSEQTEVRENRPPVCTPVQSFRNRVSMSSGVWIAPDCTDPEGQEPLSYSVDADSGLFDARTHTEYTPGTNSVMWNTPQSAYGEVFVTATDRVGNETRFKAHMWRFELADLSVSITPPRNRNTSAYAVTVHNAGPDTSTRGSLRLQALGTLLHVRQLPAAEEHNLELPDLAPGQTATFNVALESFTAAATLTARLAHTNTLDERPGNDTASFVIGPRAAPSCLNTGASVTINGDRTYTRSRNVTARITYPSLTRSIQLGLHPDLSDARAISGKAAHTIPVTLTGDPGPHIVYARLDSDCEGAGIVSDTIILDMRPPRFGTALAKVRAGRIAGRHLLVTDPESGVIRIQITQDRRRPGKWRAYSAQRIHTTGALRWVRARDRAGNISSWFRLRP